MAKTDLTAQRLRELLHYNPENGLFVWRVCCKPTKPIGSIAGTKNHGYVQIGVDQTRFYAHRLAWFYMKGIWPENQIDHIDRNGMNNSFANLRDVPASVNLRNTVRANRYGQGVKKNRGHTWCSRIAVGDECVYLGNFLSAESAEKAFLDCRALHSQGDSKMRAFAEKSRLDAAKIVAASKLQIIVNELSMSVPMAAKKLGIPERTMYYRLNTGTYSALQTFDT